MFIEYLRKIITRRPTIRKVEPPEPIEKDFTFDKEEPAVIVEIVYDNEEEQKLPQEYYDQPERKHTLSIWV